jgi:hypothetical protein
MDLDFVEARPVHGRLKAAPDRLDFGKFRHRSIQRLATARWLISNT